MSFFKDVKNKILDAISKKLNRATKRAIPDITEKIRKESLYIWRTSDTYHSLMVGELNHELGFPKGSAFELVDGFLEEVANSLRVDFVEFTKPKGSFFGGGLYVYVLRQDLSNALGSAFSSFKTDKDYDIKWAEWLLTRGNSIIISSHVFRLGFSEFSRSGDGIMIKSRNGVWRVPSEYSGVLGNNWLTRELRKNMKTIDKKYQIIFEEELKRNL